MKSTYLMISPGRTISVTIIPLILGSGIIILMWYVHHLLFWILLSSFIFAILIVYVHATKQKIAIDSSGVKYSFGKKAVLLPWVDIVEIGVTDMVGLSRIRVIYLSKYTNESTLSSWQQINEDLIFFSYNPSAIKLIESFSKLKISYK